jgi:hypothetical protein
MMIKSRVSPSERLEFAIVTRRMPGAHPFWRELPGRIFDFRRARKQQPQLTFGGYLALVNNLDGSLRSNLKNLSKIQLNAIAGALTSFARRATSVFDKSRPTHIVSIFTDERWHGWFPPEETDFGSLRWSTPHASVQLPTAPHHKKIVIEMAPIRPWPGDLHDRLSFRLNRLSIDRKTVHFDDWRITIDIDAGMFSENTLQRLEIRCEPLIAPGGDPRKLGIPVKQISLIGDAPRDPAVVAGPPE